jgi:hypothetical protein
LGEGRGSEQGTAGQKNAAEQRDELAALLFDHLGGLRLLRVGGVYFVP